MDKSALNNLLQIRLQQTKSEATRAIARLSRATTLREVRDCSRVRIAPELRHLKRSVPDLARLEREASDRALALVRTQIDGLRKITCPDALLLAVNRLRQQEWVFLRGYFPIALQLADRESMSLLHQAKPKDPESEMGTTVSRPRPV